MSAPHALAGLVFATSNPGKIREAGRLLGTSIESSGVAVPEIQSLDFLEVVCAKARAAAALLSCPVLVEDSGLEVTAWSGYPGPLTKWLTAAAGEAGLAQMLDPFGDRRATAVSVLAVARPGSDEVVTARGAVAGRIAFAPRGGNGFGWDVLFVPEGHTRTFAEMSDDEKDACSHRARAFEALRTRLT